MFDPHSLSSQFKVEQMSALISRGRLHEPGLIFNPGQCATGGYFFILFTWTRVEGDSSQPGSAILNPGQQFSTRADTYNIPCNALEPSVFFRAKVRIMADNNHYNVDAMNAEEKRRKVVVSASAILILLLAIIQMHGVVYMFIIQQQQQIAAAQNMLMLDTMKSIRMLKQLKRRIKKAPPLGKSWPDRSLVEKFMGRRNVGRGMELKPENEQRTFHGAG